MIHMLSMAPSDLAAPLNVLDCVSAYDVSTSPSTARSLNEMDRAGRRAVYDLRAAVAQWFNVDMRACQAVLGHIIGR